MEKKTHYRAEYGDNPEQPHCNQAGKDIQITQKLDKVTCKKCYVFTSANGKWG